MQRGIRGPGLKQAMEKARVNIPGKVERIWQPFYDYQTLLAAGATSQSFFQVPIGQSGKTITDTNMELAGQIPKGQTFLITGVQVELYPGVTPGTETTVALATAQEFWNDVYAFYKTGSLILRIGSKDFIRQGNLMKFAPVNRLAGIASAAAATTVAAESNAIQISYATAAGREFTIEDLMLESNQNFNVILNDLAAMPSTVNARVGVTLNGWLFRNAQ